MRRRGRLVAGTAAPFCLLIGNKSAIIYNKTKINERNVTQCAVS